MVRVSAASCCGALVQGVVLFCATLESLIPLWLGLGLGLGLGTAVRVRLRTRG